MSRLKSKLSRDVSIKQDACVALQCVVVQTNAEVCVCVFSVLQEKVVLPKVIVVGGDEQVSPRSLQPLVQEVPPLVPLQELLLTVGVVAARALDTAAVQPGKHTPC